MYRNVIDIDSKVRLKKSFIYLWPRWIHEQAFTVMHMGMRSGYRQVRVRYSILGINPRDGSMWLTRESIEAANNEA